MFALASPVRIADPGAWLLHHWVGIDVVSEDYSRSAGCGVSSFAFWRMKEEGIRRGLCCDPQEKHTPHTRQRIGSEKDCIAARTLRK